MLRGLQRGCLWFLAAVSPFVFIEPSPYEFAFLVVLVIFIGTGLRFAPAALSLVAILGVLNLGYTIGAINLFEKQEVLYWVLTSWYLALTAIFFALALSENTQERLDALLRGYRFAAVVVSLLAIAGYFNLIPGAQEQLTLYSRARGTFKDPNVLGGFLILPAIYCLQKMIDESARSALRNAIALRHHRPGRAPEFFASGVGHPCLHRDGVGGAQLSDDELGAQEAAHSDSGHARSRRYRGHALGIAVVRCVRQSLQGARQPGSELRRRSVRPLRPARSSVRIWPWTTRSE